MRARLGEGAEWLITDYLLARVADHLAVANWQRSEDGSKGVNAPKPTYRPGQRTTQDPDDPNVTFGKSGRSFAEIDEILERARTGTGGGAPSPSS